MWHQHTIDPYLGALCVTIFGAGAVFMILHTIDVMPIEAFSESLLLVTLQ